MKRYLGKKGICHRDIKPENCLLDGGGAFLPFSTSLRLTVAPRESQDLGFWPGYRLQVQRPDAAAERPLWESSLRSVAPPLLLSPADPSPPPSCTRSKSFLPFSRDLAHLWLSSRKWHPTPANPSTSGVPAFSFLRCSAVVSPLFPFRSLEVLILPQTRHGMNQHKTRQSLPTTSPERWFARIPGTGSGAQRCVRLLLLSTAYFTDPRMQSYSWRFSRWIRQSE